MVATPPLLSFDEYVYSNKTCKRNFYRSGRIRRVKTKKAGWSWQKPVPVTKLAKFAVGPKGYGQRKDKKASEGFKKASRRGRYFHDHLEQPPEECDERKTQFSMNLLKSSLSGMIFVMILVVLLYISGLL